MINDFCTALVSENRNKALPEEMDWFAPLIGNWDFIWTVNVGKECETVQKGEWIFSRVLNGFGIQDLFIVPSREERLRLNMPNAEYGTTIRMYNPDLNRWDIYYTCVGEYTSLYAEKKDDQIIITEKTQEKMKWVFSEINENTFHWQNWMLDDNGHWFVMCDCQATRRS